MKYFVTGYHRAGTHAAAEYLSNLHKAAYIEESKIKFDSISLALALPDGACIQCPGLAHDTLTLSKFGVVYWVERDHTKIIKSMKLANIGLMAWHLMKGFRTNFPDDPIWKKIQYSDREDVHNDFIGYYTLLVKIKDYFYNTYFKGVVTLFDSEKQTYYDPEKSTAEKSTLKNREQSQITKYTTKWETTYASLSVDKI